MNAAEVKSVARQFGANLIGIAPMERLEFLPPEANPRSIFPHVKSVIVVGRRILRGALRGVEEGTNFGSTYSCFGDNFLESQFLSKTVYELTCYLEKHNIESVPMLSYKIRGAGNANVTLDYKIIAQAAGLGATGKGGFFLTSEYGHRQRLAMILVDEAFEGDELKTLSLCTNCRACSDGCPLNAVKADEKVLAGLKGQETEIFVIDNTICRRCKNGASAKIDASDEVDRYAAACGRACLVALENKLANKFENKFRKRSAWSRDISGASVELSFVGGQAPVNK